MVVCGKCGKTAVVRQEYSRLDYCASCFSSMFEAKIAKANHQFGLLRRGDVVAVGVSGGKDSGAMLFALDKLARKIGSIELKPILVDEGIAGYRDKAAKCAKQLCKTLEIELQTVSAKKVFGVTLDQTIKLRENADKLHGACSYCGVLRKYCLNKAARDAGATKLAIGHNADDFGQTFLMNLLRGEAARIEQFGVKTSNPQRKLFIPRIRPLAYCLEIECANYCVLNEIPFHRGGCPYAHEAFRGEVKDFLNQEEEKHPGVKNSLLHSALQVNEQFRHNANLAEKGKRQAGKENKKTLEENASTCNQCGEYAGRTSKGLCKACELIEGLAKK